jgi:endo-1,3-1,4-beta-glycanase ExoK
MAERQRPIKDRFSRQRRSLPPQVAWAAALVCAAALAASLWIGASLLERPITDQRKMASGEVKANVPEESSAQPSAREPASPPGLLASPAPSAKPEKVPTGKAFAERFTDGLIPARWFVSDGWSNGSWTANDWRASAVETTPDGLSLRLGPSGSGSNYLLAGGEIRTVESFLYGYFEARIKVPRDPGIVTGLFTYAERAGSVRPNEIDIEVLGRAPRVAELTIHENGRATTQKVTLPFDASAGFHTFGFDWQPRHVRWYADGNLIHEETGVAARNLVRPQQLLISLWASQTLSAWVGPLDVEEGPWRLEIACVAYAPVYNGPICR